jgi:hypothetical protein
MAKQLFNGFVRKTEQFRTKLEADIQKKIREFCPTDEEMEQYTERWLAEVRKERRIGYTFTREGYIDTEDACGNDIPATESEMRYKMLNFLDKERDLSAVFCQIDTYEKPVLFGDDRARCLDYPFDEEQVAIYQRDIMDKMSITEGVRGGDGGEMFVLRVVVAEVEKWMKAKVRAIIVRGHAI